MSDRLRVAGAVALSSFATPARAECFNCYDGLVWLLLGAIAAVIGTIVGLWWIIRTGRSWVFKWLLLAGVLYLAGRWAWGPGWQYWQVARIAAHEEAGPLPVMADREPLVLYGGEFSGRFAFGCSAAFNLFRKARGAQGFHGVAMSALAGRDLTQSLPLADLPIIFHWIEDDPAAVAIGGRPAALPTSEAEAEALLPDLASLHDLANERFRMRDLSADERQDLAGRIDYLIIDPCSAISAAESHLHRHPSIKGLPRDVEVQLAMAPLDPAQPGPVLAGLDFDLLELFWYDVAPGLLPYLSRPVIAGNTSVGQAELIRSFCTSQDGSVLAGCTLPRAP